MFGALRFSGLTEEIDDFAFLFATVMISISLTAIATIGSWFRLTKRKVPSSKWKKSKEGKVKIVVVVAFCSLIFSWLLSYITIDNLNYAFDSSEPTTYVCKIIDKSYKIGSKRQRGHQRFKIEIGGEEVWLDVTSSQFDYYSVEDEFPVHLHHGFLGRTYLIGRSID